MELIDILYTPLDLPDPPESDYNQILDWIITNNEKLEPYKKYAYDNNLTNERNDKIVWPWNMGLAYLNWDDNGPGWLCDFDKQFPDLSSYFYRVFDIPIEDLGTVVILPVKHKHKGLGFMHQDVNNFGLRIYLEFEHIGQNKLFLQKTRVPYQTKLKFPYPIDPQWLQKDIIECKTLKSRGCWFINSARAVHATLTAVEDSKRIAVIVSGNPRSDESIINRLKSKIIQSSQKYKEHAIFW